MTSPTAADVAADAAAVVRECEVVCRYLSGGAPDEYVRARYMTGLRALPPEAEAADLLDRSLLAAARWSPWTASLADSYAALARPRTALRFRTVLMLAILEHAPRIHRRFDTAPTASRVATWLTLAGAGAAAALRLIVAAPLFVPIHLVARLGAGSRASR
jgi:hypothetical protein